jgi:hypothetical protein
VRDGEPPGVANHSQREPGRSGVDADIVYADEGVAAVEFKPEEVDNVEDEICRNKSGDLATASHGIALLLKIAAEVADSPRWKPSRPR